MSIIDMFLVGIGVSMDAFAVSVCKGLEARTLQWKRVLLMAFAFGSFQALMPLIGWVLGSAIKDVIEPVDHWIAFVLLAFIGIKMIADTLKRDGCDCSKEPRANRYFLLELLALSLATSIDALVVGISFALSNIDIWMAMIIIGLTTFLLSILGSIIGTRFGSRFEKPATIAGGVALILLGLKIVFEHTGLL